MSRTKFNLSQLRSLHSGQARFSARKGPAFAFDIDGVLKQGENVLPRAKEALQILIGKNHLNKSYPFLLVTNGGGSLESARAKKLTKELGVEISEQQIVQSHTIFRALADKYGDKPVLVIGGAHDACRKVAEVYGFQQPYIPADVIAWDNSIWPFVRLSEKEQGYVKKDVDFSKVNFAAVLVFHDTRDWGRDIQLATDLLRSKDGVFGTAKDPLDPSQWTPDKQLPIYFSNPDLLWGNEFSQPRFGQGAFQESMAAVFKFTTGYELQRTTGGKPSKATYDYTSRLLYSLAHPGGDYDGRVYMVGDNPRSDIAGANAFGWESILVRTGVFRGKDTDAEHKPTVVKDDVLDGVLWALRREGEQGF
ncbi:HAD-superfamily hydrolase [Meredithblackwellia eburnea MCA 4105]